MRLSRRVPLLLQMNEVECGAACLAMLLSFHGRRTSVADCRDVCGVGRDGVTAEAIVRAARAYGLEGSGYSLEPTACARVPLPAVVHWNFNHFVVLEHFSPDAVDIVDPSIGRRRLSLPEFDAGFTGVLLVLRPGPNFERRATSRGAVWSWYVSRFWGSAPIKPLALEIMAASVLLQALGLALPLVTAALIDRVLPSRNIDSLTIMGVGLALVVATQFVASYLRGVLLAHLQQQVDAQMMLGFFEHLLSLPFTFFARRSSGDLLMRLGSNAAIRELLTAGPLSAMLDGVLVVGYLIVLLTQDILLGTLAVALGLAQSVLLLATAGQLQTVTQQQLTAQAASQSYLFEALRGIATLKASGAEARATEHWSALLTSALNVAFERNQLSAAIGACMGGLRLFAPLLLLWIGAHRVLDGGWSLGSMLGLNALAIAFLEPIGSLVTNGQHVLLARAHLERIADVLHAQPERTGTDTTEAPPFSGRIELRRVSFRYDATSAWILRDVSLTIERGQKIALVGRSGSGKSTLGMLLIGLYQPTEGEILYDGRPLALFDLRSLRRQFGVVLQEPVLFADTIRRNIGFGSPPLSTDDLRAAARQACIANEIEHMPMGWETRVSEGGGGLSGGQVQRIALARALAHRPAVLLLDEATSHLDVVTEHEVDANLSRLACTRIVIAHRLSTIRNANSIVVLDNGRIVERGSHEDLSANDGEYAHLIQRQLTPVTRLVPAPRAGVLA